MSKFRLLFEHAAQQGGGQSFPSVSTVRSTSPILAEDKGPRPNNDHPHTDSEVATVGHMMIVDMLARLGAWLPFIMMKARLGDEAPEADGNLSVIRKTAQAKEQEIDGA